MTHPKIFLYLGLILGKDITFYILGILKYDELEKGVHGSFQSSKPKCILVICNWYSPLPDCSWGVYDIREWKHLDELDETCIEDIIHAVGS